MPLEYPTLDECFGELRSLLHQRTDADRGPIQRLLVYARGLEPARYDDRWLPFLAGQELPLLQVNSLDELDGIAPCIPDNAPVWLWLFTSRCTPDSLSSYLDAHPERFPRPIHTLYVDLPLGAEPSARLLDHPVMRDVRHLRFHDTIDLEKYNLRAEYSETPTLSMERLLELAPNLETYQGEPV